MLDGIRQEIEPAPVLIRYLADRRFGIGADQVLIVERAQVPGADFRYRIFNCDGHEVEQCGNGAVALQSLFAKKVLQTRRAFVLKQ